MAIKILDLFAGVAGLSFGFERVRDKAGNQVFELHKAVEIDKYACQTLIANYGKEKVIVGDLTCKTVHRQVIDECKGKVSIVMGGIPCQSFSLIGPRSGYGKIMEQFKKDKRDCLYTNFREIVAEIKPKVVLIENVKGILSKRDSTGKKIIDKLFVDFEYLGYNFENETGEKYALLNAADYGVPQYRERVILIGLLDPEKKTKIPIIRPTHYDPNASENKEHAKRGLMPYVRLYEAIGDLPPVRPKVTLTGIAKSAIKTIRNNNKQFNNGKERIPFDTKRFVNHLKKISESGKKFFDEVRSKGYNYLNYHVARSQQITDLKLFSAMHQGETAEAFMIRNPKMAKRLIKYNMNSFTDKYRRQKASEPSTTIFAHLEKDGNRFIHPWQTRTYTPREAARIQSFPDDFIIEGPMSKKFKQIGNAVPPLLAYHIAKTIYKEGLIV